MPNTVGPDRANEQGLTAHEARQRLLAHGYNELPDDTRAGILRLIWSTVREPMILLLVGSAALYGFLGEPTESVLLMISALVVIAIDLIQEIRSDRALQALKDLSSPRALVVRDGNTVRVPARELVIGDLLIIAEGDRIAADAELISAAGLAVDESLLTGESVSVGKSVASGGNEHRRVYSGSLVVRGNALARVTRTGGETQIGQIGAALKEVKTPKSPLQRETERLVQYSAYVGIAFCILVIVLYGLLRGNWIQAALAGIALAMSLLPEEFPVVLTVFLALGARRLAQRGLLVHHMPAVEGLGTINVLCVDKTGTLTMNEMTVAALWTLSGGARDLAALPSLKPIERELLSVAQQATKFPAWDPMDKAVQSAAHNHNIERPLLIPIEEHSVTPDLPVMIHAYSDGARSFIAAKGMPEAVLRLCRMTTEEQAIILDVVTRFAERGMRVLAVAAVNNVSPGQALDRHQYDFCGLIGFQDPLRPGVPESVRECYSAGIRVVMITGDYPITASTIARAAGIDNPDRVLTGEELRTLEKNTLQRRIDETNVFARITPMQKLQLVEALKASGNVVAMTGDGVNDAPALKAAHTGVAMGARGTDVAREAAAVVLTNDDFPSLVGAIRQGRRTFDNIKKAMYYVLAMHVPIAGLAILPLLTGLPVIFYPIHIVLLELIIDPVSAIVFEAEPAERNVMSRPPRDARAPLFTRSSITIALLQGLSIFVAAAAMYLFAFYRTHSDLEARTLAFATLVLANLTLAMVNRSWVRTFVSTLRTPNRALWFSVGAGIIILAASTSFDPLAALFHFGPFHAQDWVLTISAALLSLTWFELLKLIRNRPLHI